MTGCLAGLGAGLLATSTARSTDCPLFCLPLRPGPPPQGDVVGYAVGQSTHMGALQSGQVAVRVSKLLLTPEELEAYAADGGGRR